MEIAVVNDVEFYTDRDGLGAQTAGEGVVEKGGVSITTTSTNILLITGRTEAVAPLLPVGTLTQQLT